MGLGRALDERFGGEVPPGHGGPGHPARGGPQDRQRGAAAWASVCPVFPVDTHVTRLTRLLGLTESTDPVRIESDVCALLPRRSGARSASV